MTYIASAALVRRDKPNIRLAELSDLSKYSINMDLRFDREDAN